MKGRDVYVFNYCNCTPLVSHVPIYEFTGSTLRGNLEKEFILDTRSSPYVYLTIGVRKGLIQVRNETGDYDWSTRLSPHCVGQPAVLNRVGLKSGIYTVTTQKSNEEMDQSAEGGWTLVGHSA